jgi:hypothetical protein
MRLPRLRLRTLLVAVAIAAVILGCLGRPYPFVILVGGGKSRITWSNGAVTEGEWPSRVPRRCRIRGPLVAIDWADGATTWHLRVPYEGRRVWWSSIELGY